MPAVVAYFALNDLGTALQALGQDDAAVLNYRRAIQLDPALTLAHSNLGQALLARGQPAEAAVCFQQVLSINPANDDAHNHLGTAQQALGQLAEAVESYQRALALNPDHLVALHNLSVAQHGLGQLSDAAATYRRLLASHPADASVHNDLGNALLGLGLLEQAVASYHQALALKPDLFTCYSNMLFALSHSEKQDGPTLFAEHLRFAERAEAPLQSAWPKHSNSREAERTLQVGLVSGDFYSHVVARFAGPLLAQLAGCAGLSLHAYANNTVEDNVTQILKGYFDHWHPVAELSDEALARQISTDGIDILIDLSGHTKGNRLLTFARKPAPVQVSWLGYPGSTGLRAMDYYLADVLVSPAGRFDNQFTEKIVRLPALAPFQQSDVVLPVNELPALTNGFVTFGSFNRASKINKTVITCWTQLLHALPTSKLLIEGVPSDAQCIEWLQQEGIDCNRLSWHARKGMDEYNALHQKVDICLDTFPYNGATTSWSAVLMGVPTLTITGNTPAGYYGTAIMEHLGLQSFVASDAQDFVQKGIYWSSHLDHLAQIRASMRRRFSNCPVSKNVYE